MKYSRIVKILCGYVTKLWQLVAILWLTSCMTNVAAMKLLEMPINSNAQQLKQAIADNQVATVAAILKEDGYTNPEARAEFLCAIKNQEAVLVECSLGKLLATEAGVDAKPQQMTKLAQTMLSIARQDFASLDRDFLVQLYPKLERAKDGFELYDNLYDLDDFDIDGGAVDSAPTPLFSLLDTFNLNVFLLMLDTITFFIDDIKQVEQAIEQMISICDFPADLSSSVLPRFTQLLLSACARQDQALWEYCAQRAKRQRNFNVFIYMLHEYADRSYFKGRKTFGASDDLVPSKQELGALIMLAKQAQHLLYETQQLERNRPPQEANLCHGYDAWISGRSYLDTVIRDLSYRDLYYYKDDSAVKLYRLRDGRDSNIQAHMKILEAGVGGAYCDALVELVEIFLQNQPTTTARLDELLTTIDPVFLRRVIPRIILQCHKYVLGRNGNINQLLHHLLESHPEIINIDSQDPDSQRTVFVQALALNDFERAYLLMTHFNANCQIKDQDGIKLVDLGAKQQSDPYLLQIKSKIGKQQVVKLVQQHQQQERQQEQIGKRLANELRRFVKVTTLALDAFGPSIGGL